MDPTRDFADTRLPEAVTTTAPDGSDVRVLLALERGSMAQFELAAGRVSGAVRHRTVEEIWYVIDGAGEMWRRTESAEATIAMSAGVCLTIPVGTAFQFRSAGPEPLRVVAITMPPWPWAEEAEPVAGNPAWDAVRAGSEQIQA